MSALSSLPIWEGLDDLLEARLPSALSFLVISYIKGSKEDQMRQDLTEWRVKRLMEPIKRARGNGTCLISLYVPHGDSLLRLRRMLFEETGAAMKARFRRLNILAALTSIQQRIKQYDSLSTNGLVLFAGLCTTEEGREVKFTVDFEPPRPLQTSVFLCDNKFHWEDLTELLTPELSFGFIVIHPKEGNLLAVLKGTQITWTLLPSFSENEQEFLQKVNQACLCVSSLLLLASDESLLLPIFAKLAPQLLPCSSIFITSLGGYRGVYHAIAKMCPTLCYCDVALAKEISILAQFFRDAALPNRCVYGVTPTSQAVEAGACAVLLVSDSLRLDGLDQKTESILLENYPSLFAHAHVSKRCKPFVQWAPESFASIQIVSDQSPEGHRFLCGFEGIGAFLRHPFQADLLAETPHLPFSPDFDKSTSMPIADL